MSSLERLNAQLKAEFEEQQRTAALLGGSEARVKAEDLELERRVDERTAELRAANARLTEALEHHEILLREVYHRVKNNLQTVDILLASEARQMADQEAVAAFRSMRQRVLAMGLVHQQLMRSKDLKTFDIAPFLQDLTKNIMESRADHGVKLSLQTISLTVGLDFALPVGLLVAELLTNSLKHAFPDGVGDISVVLERAYGDKVALIVADNGRVLSSAKPAPFANTPGRGINIITGLVAQLKGALSMETKDGTRTEIYIAAPVLP
jgi:two-component sensor histidine kinase